MFFENTLNSYRKIINQAFKLIQWLDMNGKFLKTNKKKFYPFIVFKKITVFSYRHVFGKRGLFICMLLENAVFRIKKTNASV